MPIFLPFRSAMRLDLVGLRLAHHQHVGRIAAEHRDAHQVLALGLHAQRVLERALDHVGIAADQVLQRRGAGREGGGVDRQAFLLEIFPVQRDEIRDLVHLADRAADRERDAGLFQLRRLRQRGLHTIRERRQARAKRSAFLSSLLLRRVCQADARAHKRLPRVGVGRVGDPVDELPKALRIFPDAVLQRPLRRPAEHALRGRDIQRRAHLHVLGFERRQRVADLDIGAGNDPAHHLGDLRRRVRPAGRDIEHALRARRGAAHPAPARSRRSSRARGYSRAASARRSQTASARPRTAFSTIGLMYIGLRMPKP